ncbi:MAG: tetratricopeptide repeat protein [Butyrivibrio sp.]|nr:tetratricopeptide repeat protein [Butyrivibrio sp.]
MKRNGKYRLLPLICIAAMLCTGCSGFSSRKNIDSGMNYISDHDYQNALTSFSQAQQQGENERLVFRGMGIAYLKLARYEDAAAAFEKSLSASIGIADSMDYDTSYYLAEAFSESGAYDKAIEVYDAILNLHGKERNAYYLRGVTKLKSGDNDGASADFTKAIALQPKDYDRMIMIYQALADYGEQDKGTAILQSAMQQGSSSMSNFEKGQISYYLGNNADAQNYLEEARSEKGNSDNASVILLLGQTGEKQGDYNYAVSVYKSFLQDNPEHADVYNRLGICEMKMGSYEAAVADFEAGLALKDVSVNQALMRNEITAYEYAGNFDQAKTLMASYEKVYPQDAEAAREEIFLSTR